MKVLDYHIVRHTTLHRWEFSQRTSCAGLFSLILFPPPSLSPPVWHSWAQYRSTGGHGRWFHSSHRVRHEREWLSGTAFCLSADAKRTRESSHHARGAPQSADCAAGGHAGTQARHGRLRKEGFKQVANRKRAVAVSARLVVFLSLCYSTPDIQFVLFISEHSGKIY